MDIATAERIVADNASGAFAAISVGIVFLSAFLAWLGSREAEARSQCARERHTDTKPISIFRGRRE